MIKQISSVVVMKHTMFINWSTVYGQLSYYDKKKTRRSEMYTNYDYRISLITSRRYYFRPYLPASGGNKQGCVQVTPAFEMHMMPLCMALILGMYRTLHEYRPAKQVIWVVQVILVANSECGCVTVWELFESKVNFLPLKRALTSGINSRVGRNQENMVCSQ